MLDVHDPNNVLPDEDFPEAARRFPPLAHLAESLSNIKPYPSERDRIEEILKALLAFVGRLPPGQEIAKAHRLLALLMFALADVDRGKTPALLRPTPPGGSKEVTEDMALDYLAAAHAYLCAGGLGKAAACQRLAEDLAKMDCEADAATVADRVEYRKTRKRGSRDPDVTQFKIEDQGTYDAILEVWIGPHLRGKLAGS